MHLIFGATPEYWHVNEYATFYLWLSPGLLAMGSVGFLAMAMQLSWTTASATMFTIFMTVSNVGHVIGNKLVGVLRSEDSLNLSYEHTFFTAGVAMILPLLMLIVVRPEQIDESKFAELR